MSLILKHTSTLYSLSPSLVKSVRHFQYICTSTQWITQFLDFSHRPVVYRTQLSKSGFVSALRWKDGKWLLCRILTSFAAKRMFGSANLPADPRQHSHSLFRFCETHDLWESCKYRTTDVTTTCAYEHELYERK